MTYFPITPYIFAVVTLAGTVKISFPATQWDIAVSPETDGPGAAILAGYLAEYGIGFRGQLFTLEAVSPMDLHHALLMNATTHHGPLIVSFDVIGYVPETNPDAEDDSRWADEEDDEDDGNMGISAVLESAIAEDWREELYAAMAEDGHLFESSAEDNEWRLKPSVLGRLQGKALQEVRALGFDTEESAIVIDGSAIAYIRTKHGNQLTQEDEKYLKLAVTHPTEILPNIDKGGFMGVGRSKSVLMIYRGDKDYMTIVEVGPKDGTNVVWNFWKMKGAKASNYLAKFRQEKARILQSGGATIAIPRVPPTNGGSGKPEGLPGSQTEEAGSSDSKVSKDGKPVKPILESATAEEVHAAAHEAATSHLNDLPEPTEAQKLVGKYKMGHVRMHGLDITIENPKGSERKGIDPDGKPWAVTMPYHYGYIKGTLAVDGDHVDCCIGDHPESELVFVTDQVDAKTGRYDEVKCILGCLSQKDAHTLFISGFSDNKGAKRLGAMTALHMPDFKSWLSGDTTKPLSDAIMEAAFTESELREWAQRSPLAWKARILDAVSFDDIQAAFAQKWPGVISPPAAVRYRGMENLHPTAMAEVEKVLGQIVNDFGLPEIGVSVGTDSRRALGTASWGGFSLNKKFENKPLNEIDKELQLQYRLGWVTAHEAGHVIEHIIEDAPDVRGEKNLGYQRAIRKIKADQAKDTSADGGTVTLYAQKNNSEFVAEHFADAVIRGDKASPYSKLVYQTLKEWYAKNKYKSFRDASNGYKQELDKERAIKAEKLARAITKETLPGNGSIVEDKFGKEYLVMMARNSIVNVVPIIDGKAQVNSESRISFNIDPGFTPASDQTRNQPLYTTGRDYYAD